MKSAIKKLMLAVLRPTFGSKRWARFYTVLKNISLRGLNYRNHDHKTNGELFFLKAIQKFYSKNSVPTELVLFDVGANIGNYAVELNNMFPDKRIIYSFEPFKEVYNKLQTLTNTIANFKPIQEGFSNKKEVLSFYTNSEYSEIGGVYDKDFSQFGFSTEKVEELNFDTIDNFCKNNGVNKINMLKVDVEGHDFFVLEGAKEMIEQQQIDFIQFEFGTANYLSKTHFYDFFKLLSNNYVLAKLLADGYIRIDSYNTDVEMHLLSNYVAVNKNLIGNGFKM